MAGRIVLFGATGYTGRLTAKALTGTGAKPLLAGRSKDALDELAAELGGGAYETAARRRLRPASVRALLGDGDVMLTTVGPFARWGEPAMRRRSTPAAPTSTRPGSPPSSAERSRSGARGRGERCGVADRARLRLGPGQPRRRLGAARGRRCGSHGQVGYFITGAGGGGLSSGMSGGTMASLAGALLEPGFAYRGGRIVTEQGGRRVRDFEVNGRKHPAVSIGSSEHFTLPRLAPGVATSRPTSAGSARCRGRCRRDRSHSARSAGSHR